MALPIIDTNIFIRFLTGDDPEKQATCAVLFHQIEKGKRSAFVPDMIVAEVVYVLSSARLYHHSHQEVAELVTPLLSLPHLQVANRQVHLRALRMYAETPRLDYADAYIVALMEQGQSNDLISYDSDYDRFPFITRKEPEPIKHAA